MRWVVALLVVANLAFFAWQYQEHERAAARREAPEELAYVSRLLLLSEAPPPSPPAVAAAPEPAPAIAEAPAAASAAAEAGVAKAPRAEATAAKVPPAEGLPAQAQVAEAAAARGPVVEPSAAEPTSHDDPFVQVPLAEPPVAQALPRPAASLEKPVPGAEPRPSAEGTAAPEPPPVAAATPPATAPPAPSAVAPPAPAVAPPAPAVAPAAPTPPRRCYTVGPLAEDGPAAAVRDWLTQRGASTELRWATRQEPRSFWVYLPPPGSAEESRGLAARLAQAGVTDVMRLPAGPQANAISLGLYIRRPAAEKRQAEVKRLGFDAQIEARTRDVREAWVSATYAPGAELPLAALRGAFPDTKVVARDCP